MSTDLRENSLPSAWSLKIHSIHHLPTLIQQYIWSLKSHIGSANISCSSDLEKKWHFGSEIATRYLIWAIIWHGHTTFYKAYNRDFEFLKPSGLILMDTKSNGWSRIKKVTRKSLIPYNPSQNWIPSNFVKN